MHPSRLRAQPPVVPPLARSLARFWRAPPPQRNGRACRRARPPSAPKRRQPRGPQRLRSRRRWWRLAPSGPPRLRGQPTRTMRSRSRTAGRTRARWRRRSTAAGGAAAGAGVTRQASATLPAPVQAALRCLRSRRPPQAPLGGGEARPRLSARSSLLPLPHPTWSLPAAW